MKLKTKILFGLSSVVAISAISISSILVIKHNQNHLVIKHNQNHQLQKNPPKNSQELLEVQTLKNALKIHTTLTINQQQLSEKIIEMETLVKELEIQKHHFLQLSNQYQKEIKVNNNLQSQNYEVENQLNSLRKEIDDKKAQLKDLNHEVLNQTDKLTTQKQIFEKERNKLAVNLQAETREQNELKEIAKLLDTKINQILLNVKIDSLKNIEQTKETITNYKTQLEEDIKTTKKNYQILEDYLQQVIITHVQPIKDNLNKYGEKIEDIWGKIN